MKVQELLEKLAHVSLDSEVIVTDGWNEYVPAVEVTEERNYVYIT